MGKRIRALYRSKDSKGRPCDVLYFFWVMQVPCLECRSPRRSVPVLGHRTGTPTPTGSRRCRFSAPSCGDIFPGLHGQDTATCRSCSTEFDPSRARPKEPRPPAGIATSSFTILDAVASTGTRPAFRLYGKLVLTRGGAKEYLPATPDDQAAYQECSARLEDETERGQIRLPTLALEHGYNTRQAMSYGFTSWRDFFNDRQLLALGWLHAAIARIADAPDAGGPADAVLRRAGIQ